MNVYKTFKSLEPENLRNLLVLFATGLFFWTSITTLLPTLPAYIFDVGGTTQQVGLVMGCFAIGLLFSRTWLGQLADQKSRKLVVLIGTLVGATAPLGYLFVQSIYPMMVIRAYHGISIAAFTTGFSTLVVDLSPVKQRGELIGYMSLAIPVGMAIGPALGGYLQEGLGYQTLFLVSAGLGILGFVLASCIGEQKKPLVCSLPTETEIVPKRSRGFWEIAIAPSIVIPSLILLLIGMLFGTLASFLPLFVRALDLELNVGLYYMAAAIASFSVRFFIGGASDRYGRGLFISISLICYGISMLLLALTESPELFLVSAILEGAGGGILMPMVLALLSDRSYSDERGKVYAVGTGGFDVGVAIAGPVLGALSSSIGYRGMFLMTACFALISLLVFITQSNKTLSYSLRFALGKGKDLYALE